MWGVNTSGQLGQNSISSSFGGYSSPVQIPGTTWSKAHVGRKHTLAIKTDVIGSGGKVIREIVEESGAKVDINDDGIVKIASSDTDSLNKALELINSIVAEPEAGEIYEG